MLVFINFYSEHIKSEIDKNVTKCEKDWKLIFKSENPSKAHADVGGVKRVTREQKRLVDNIHKNIDF